MNETFSEKELGIELDDVVRTFHGIMGNTRFRIEILRSNTDQCFSPRCWNMRTIPGSKDLPLEKGHLPYTGVPWEVWVHAQVHSEHECFATMESALRTALRDLGNHLAPK
jgi:hypothetical protein